jgi:hypothetical protein
MKHKQKQQLPLIPADSALAQLERRLAVMQGIPTNPPPDVLPLILNANMSDRWRPPDERVLSEPAAMQMIRRCAVAVILDNAPPMYQRPRSTATLEWVMGQLAKLSPSLAGQFSDDTLQKDIEDWAYNPKTGRRRGRRGGRSSQPLHRKSNVKMVKPPQKTKANVVKPPRRKTKASANRPTK